MGFTFNSTRNPLFYVLLTLPLNTPTPHFRSLQQPTTLLFQEIHARSKHIIHPAPINYTIHHRFSLEGLFRKATNQISNKLKKVSVEWGEDLIGTVCHL